MRPPRSSPWCSCRRSGIGAEVDQKPDEFSRSRLAKAIARIGIGIGMCHCQSRALPGAGAPGRTPVLTDHSRAFTMGAGSRVPMFHVVIRAQRPGNDLLDATGTSRSSETRLFVSQ